MIVLWSGRNLLINFLGMINKQLSSYLQHWVSVYHPASLAGFVFCMVSFAWWPSLPMGRPNLFIMIPLMITLLIMPRYLTQTRRITLRKVGYFSIGLIIACVYCNWIGHQYIQTTKSINFKTPMLVQGEVISLHHEDITTVKKSRIKVRVSHINHHAVTPFNIRLNWYYPTANVLQGQQWQFNVKLKPARGLANEEGFDYHRYLVGQNVLATGYVRQTSDPVLLNHEISWTQTILTAMHTRALSHQAWINALILGHKDGLTKPNKDLIRQTGTAHLMVISGLHIGIVAGWIYLFFNMLAKVAQLVCRDTSPSIYVLVATLVGTWSYCQLLGFTIPMLRAFIVLTICLYVHYRQLNISLWHKCLMCLAGVLICFPFSSFNTGFWLSFIAVSAIGIIVHCLSIAVRSTWDKIIAFVMIQLALTVLLIPINIMVFGQFYPWSMVANLWAIPIVTLFLVPIGMVLLAMSITQLCVDWVWLDTVIDMGLWLANLGFTGLISGLESMLQMPYLSRWLAPVKAPLGGMWCLCLLVGILALCIIGKQWRLWAWCFMLIPAGMSVWAQQHAFEDKSAPNITFTVFDVGQGSSGLLLVNEEGYVFDVGDDFGEAFNMVNSVLLPYLDAQPKVTLSALYISHFDKDHAGGIPRFQRHYPSTPIYSPESGCWQGVSQQWPNHINIDMLWPPKSISTEALSNNNASCVLRISLPNEQHILITGDIETRAEQALIQAHDNGEIDLGSDVLVVPHHGSKTSSNQAFIERVAPKYAVVSVGFMNRYHLPNEVVIQRYHDANVTVLSTAKVGQITFTWFGEELASTIDISTARGTEYDPWYRQRWYEND